MPGSHRTTVLLRMFLVLASLSALLLVFPPGCSGTVGAGPDASCDGNIGGDADGDVDGITESDADADGDVPGLRAVITATPASGDGPLDVELSGCASEGEILVYTWDFGDGSRGTGAEVEHVFSPGRYTVALTVTDVEGRSTSTSQTIEVAGPEPAEPIRDGSGHPRLYFDAAGLEALRQRVARVPVLGAPGYRESYVAGFLLDDRAWQGAPWYRDNGGDGCSDYIGARLGDSTTTRDRWVNTGRQIADCLTTLAAGAVLDPDAVRGETFADAAIAAMMRMATVWPSAGWDTPGSPSDEWDAAGLVDADLQNGFGRWLCGACTNGGSNLQNGELLYAVAVAFDLLHGRMTEDERDAVRDLLWREARHVHLKSQHRWTWWTDDGGNNWQAVIHGPLGLAAFVLRGEPGIDDVELDAMVARAVDQVEQYLATNFDQAGAGFEDMGHSNYGLFYAADLFRALRALEGDDHTGFGDGLLHRALRYLVHATAPTFAGLMPNDGVGWSHTTNPVLLVLPGLYRDGFGAWTWDHISGAARPRENDFPWKVGGDGAQSQLARTVFLYDDTILHESPAGRLSRSLVSPGFGRAHVRSAWDDPEAACLAVECGIYGSHGRPNQGHFFYVARGAHLIDDAGGAGPDFNILRLDGEDQRSAGGHEMLASTRSSLEGRGSFHVSYDTAAAYQPEIDRLWRDFFFVQEEGGTGPYLVVLDSLSDDAGHDAAWLLHGFAGTSWQEVSERHRRLDAGQAALEVVSLAPDGATLRVDDARGELRVESSGAHQTFVTLLYATDEAHAMPAFAPLAVGAARGFTLGDDTMLYDPDRSAPLAAGGAEGDGEVLFLRGPAGARHRAVLTGGTALAVDGAAWLASTAPATAEIEPGVSGLLAWLSCTEEASVRLGPAEPGGRYAVVADHVVQGIETAGAEGLVPLGLLEPGARRRVELISLDRVPSCP